MDVSDTAGGVMSDQPSDQPTDQPVDPAAKPPLADTIRAKLEEYEVDRHLNDLATTLEGAVRQGVARAGELAHEHKGDIDRLLDKAASAVDRHTDGKHAERISQVRGTLDRGVERIADQRSEDTAEGAAGAGAGESPVSDVPPSNG
jgi:RNA-splicing ligase RtcB